MLLIGFFWFLDFLFYFVVISSCVLLLSASFSSVFPVFCFSQCSVLSITQSDCSTDTCLTPLLLALPCFQFVSWLFPHSLSVCVFYFHMSVSMTPVFLVFLPVFPELLVCSLGNSFSGWICYCLILSTVPDSGLHFI